MAPRGCLAVMAAVAVTAGTALAGQPPQQEPGLTLRATTRLVQVEVIVRDRRGKPVTGLTKDDFQVREEGKLQEVRFFTGYTGTARQASDLPPGMFSNRPEITGPRRGVTVILIDSLNTAWASRARALDNLRKFLKGAQPDDRIAIYTLGNELKIFQDFTGDARSLMKKIEQHQTSPLENRGEGPLLDALVPEVAAFSRWAQKTEEDARTVARVEATLDALEKVANHMGSTPGSKSLIWISDGIPLQVGMSTIAGSVQVARGLEHRTFDREFEKAVRALTSSNVAVYPIDPRGLQELSEFSGTGQMLAPATRPWLETNSVFTQLATRTGGRAYVDQNGILGALKQLTDEAQASYTVAYYPANSSFDGGYRKVDIRMKKAGLTASHRKGYYALDAAEVKREDGLKEIRAAALDPLDAAVIGIDAGLRETDGGHEVFARIDAADLLWPDKGGFSVQTSIGVFQYDADGRQLESVVDNIDFTCDAAKAALLSQYGLSYGRKVSVSSSAARLRLVVRSGKTGSIGSITVPIAR